MTSRNAGLPALLAITILASACGVASTASEVTPGPNVEAPAELSVLNVEVLEADQATPEAVASAAPEPEATPSPVPLAPTAVRPRPTTTPLPIAAADPQEPTPVPTRSPEELVAEAIQAINAARAASALGVLTPNRALATAAARHARDMAQSNFLGHNGTDGSTPDSRLRAAGYTSAWRGEALASGFPSGQIVADRWLASAAHRAILLDPIANEIGVGYYYQAGTVQGHYWVMDIGAR